MKKITRHYSQTLYLFVIYGLFILVLLGIFFTYTYTHYRNNTLEDSERSLENMCASINNFVEIQLNDLSTLSMNIVYSNMIKTNFKDFSDSYQKTDEDETEIVSSRQNAETIHDIVTAMIGAYQSASEIKLYDMNGSYVESGYWMSISKVELESLSWYDEVLELNGYKYISTPKTRKDLPATGKNLNAQRFISLIRLFLDRDGMPEGIAEVVQDCGKIFALASQLEDSNPDIQVYIYNSRNELVYPYTAFGIYEAESYENLIEKNGIKDGSCQIVKNKENENVLVTCGTMETYGWNVVLLQSEASIYKSLETFRKMFIRITCLSILLTLLICFYISRRFTIPLQKLTAATKKITIGRVLDEKKVNLTTADSNIKELSILCNSVRNMYDKLRSNSREILLLRNEEMRAKLQATQSLINPHFLYNSLTTISAMAEEDMKDDIVKICEALCVHFRYISASGEMIVPLRKELEKSRYYLECMRLRFTEELEFTFDIPENVKDIPVPKLIAQPVLENAFKYAFVCRPPWKLSITARLDGEHWQLMIEEDESLIRRNLVKKLDALNLPLQKAGEAANGEEAIQLIDKYCPQLVITDIRMPLCDGLEVVKYLYNNYPGTKVIILSGYDDFSYAQKAIQYSVEDYLLKPVSKDTLSESIQKILIKMETESDKLSIYNTKNSSLSPEALSQLVQKYLLENYQQEISFQELGEKFGFTPEYLGKIFKKYTGATLSKYLTKLRMNEAKRLLINEQDMEIQKIGELVGYKDGFYFSRVFKTYTGMQPSEFRNQNTPGTLQSEG